MVSVIEPRRLGCEIQLFFVFNEGFGWDANRSGNIFYLSQIKNSVNASKIFPYKNNFTYFVKYFTENVWRIKIKALYLH